ncbi:NAD(P)HX epimerase / NAD(P)HX dehydratase [Enhygromyxa salina]|uniref:Bifunctional NAD(P)H-hydrate repair enzyme n=1 Tax=Enhygromyxa salina TaxID=215803 RepID=A0A0C2D964_9BACT|nr:bifunctional ADP-dependent NAD(P)H-hydrate dehydratase/NAD(P)H-hydrate epimerase [Enhygromyxa salina]KIG18145.1 NAD(P)HX epimerase / NAD(P)HX dehydratase [Enhygromyxa salina]
MTSTQTHVRASAPAALWTASTAAAADRYTIDVLGMPSSVLIERAALCVSAEVERLAEAAGAAQILILVGPGNNGGDGLAVARQLHGRGREVIAVVVGERHNAAVAAQLALARAHGVKIVTQLPKPSARATIIVDALLGTGSRGAPRGAVGEALQWLGELVEELGRERVHVVAVDLPSGVDVDSGAVAGAVATAALTVTFQRSKPGLHLTPARDHIGELVVAEIGLVAKVEAAEQREPVELIDLIEPGWVAARLARLPSAAHKGRRGHVGVIGGGGGTPGAAILAATAAMRSGAGLATLAPNDADLRRALIELRPELMLADPDDAWVIPQADALVVGPGLVDPDQRALDHLHHTDARPMVWDASGLDEYAGEPGAGPRVVTPHPGEAARMLARLDPGAGWDNARVQADRRLAAQRLAALTGAVVVLKGEGTLVSQATSSQMRLAICTRGGPALATAGSGDVLAGVIAALLARGLDSWSAACVGVDLHAGAGDRLREDGTLAMDIAEMLPTAFSEAAAGHSSMRWPAWVRG